MGFTKPPKAHAANLIIIRVSRAVFTDKVVNAVTYCVQCVVIGVYRLVGVRVGQVVLDVGVIIRLVQHVSATLRNKQVELLHLLDARPD